MPFHPALGERTLTEARGSGFTVWVTSRRLVAERSRLGNRTLTYLPLEKVDYVEHTRTSSPVWLVLAALFGVFGVGAFIGGATEDGGVADVSTGIGVALIVIAVIFVLIWLATRNERLIFMTHRGTLNIETKGMASNMADRLLTESETARQHRMSELYTAPLAQSTPATPRPTAPRVELVD